MNQAPAHDILRESEERLRLAFWAANIGFWTWDLKTQAVYLSPIWKSQLGYQEHELPDEFSTWEKLLHPEDRESSWKVINEARNDPQRTFEIYFRLRHKDQSYRWILSRGRVYRDDAGTAIRIMGCHVDVTQQKEDERLLRESESRLLMVLEGGRMGMWVWDLAANQVSWNRKEYELLDLPVSEGNREPGEFFKHVHPDDQQKVRDSIDQSIKQYRDFYEEFRVVRPDGSIRWLVGAGRTLRDPQTGAATQMMGVNYDITPAKQAHASLQEAHEFIKQIINNAQEGIVVFDRNLRYRLWNPFMESLSGGIKEEEVVGKTMFEVFPYLKEPEIEGYLEKALGGEHVSGKDVYHGSPELKRTGWTTGRYGPLRNVRGEIVGVLATIREITERKLTEQKLNDYRQRMELILEQLPSILWTTDRELKINSSMGAGLKAVGMSPHSTVGLNLREIVVTPDHPSIAAHEEALKGHSVSYDNEFRGRPFRVYVEPLRDQMGTIQGCIGLALDVTEAKRQEAERQALERRIQQTQKLESLEVLAGGIAHDFNNLLTGMLGYASLAQMELPADSPVKEMIHEIEKAAQRAADLSRQMLAYSGKGKFIIETIRLDELVVEMAGLLKTIVSTKAQLHMVTEPVVIEGDATQIRQVVMNLITNAADAIHGEGYIALRTGKRHYSTSDLANMMIQGPLPAGEYAFLEVQDNGTGMTDEVKSRIFDPFFTTKFTGRGLGLASVLGIVRGHRGTIAVESRAGSGTLFRVLLPISSTKAQAAVTAIVSQTTDLQQGTILVIEDDPNVLNFVEFVLEKAGYDVVSTTESSQAGPLFEKHSSKIRAAVIDLTMPGMNGIELAQQLRSICASLPILIISGYTQEEVAPRFSGMSISGFLQKPFRAHDLLNSLQRLANEKQQTKK